MTILFGFANRVFLVGLKAPIDRLRPDDSILALVRVFGGFDDEVVRGVLECLVCHAWSRSAVKDRLCREMPFPESIFRFRSRSKQPYRTMLIQPSAHQNSSIIRLLITTVLSTMSLSRTVNMQ